MARTVNALVLFLRVVRVPLDAPLGRGRTVARVAFSGYGSFLQPLRCSGTKLPTPRHEVVLCHKTASRQNFCELAFGGRDTHSAGVKKRTKGNQQ